MQYTLNGWILKRRKDISEKTSETQIQSNGSLFIS
jgi:hypothetical protein